MSHTLLYVDPPWSPNPFEREIFGPDVVLHQIPVADLAEIPATIRAEVEGLMLFRHFFRRDQFDLFPRLRAIVRMGVGYDRIDRAVAAERGVIVCNVPDYGTAEVSDHAIALALGLSRGAFLHYDLQRGESPAGWQPVESSLLRRSSSTVYGIVGLGRIGMAAALKARALGSDVIFYDPGLPNGVEISLGLRRARKLDDLLTQAAILSLHVPLTPETRNMIGSREIALLPKGAIIINTARGPVLDLEAATAALRSGHLAGLGLDVLPELVRAVRAREDWVLGRVVITPHIAFCSPDASVDVHRKAVETMHEVLTTGHSMNIIRPDQY
jgi:C-terminal binding protein